MNASSSHRFSRSSAACVSVVCLALWLSLCVSVSVWGQDGTNQFLFLRLRLKAGEITLVDSSLVNGTLKPQRNSEELESLVVSLEATTGEERWSLAIADPSLQRLEYEDPDQPGSLRSKLVKVDDVEFVVRAPLKPGVRQVAVFRKEKTGQQANEKRLLARMALPAQAIK